MFNNVQQCLQKPWIYSANFPNKAELGQNSLFYVRDHAYGVTHMRWGGWHQLITERWMNSVKSAVDTELLQLRYYYFLLHIIE